MIYFGSLLRSARRDYTYLIAQFAVICGGLQVEGAGAFTAGEAVGIYR